LLKGLEISIITYKMAMDEDETGRIDSSFFEKKFIELRKMTAIWERLDLNAKSIVCGPFGSNLLNDNYVEKGIPMVRPFNLRNGRIDAGDVALVGEDFVDKNNLKTFGRGTLMFARVGEIGAGISLGEKVTISPNIIAAELNEKIDPYFVGVFANTRFGQLQLEAGMKVVAQPTISTDAIRALRIPQLSKSFQLRIAGLFHLSVSAQDAGKRKLVDVEATLLRALGLENWKAPEPLSYVRSSGEVFAAGRLDAEYFTPRFLSLMNVLGRDGLKIADVAPARHKKFNPSKAGKSFNYIEIGDVSNDGSVESTEIATTDAPSRATQYVEVGDVLTSTVRPIRRLSALVDTSQDGAVCSSGFVVLVPMAISPSTLLTYLRLPLICELMDLHTSASLYPAISEHDLLRLPIPHIPENVQKKLDNLVNVAREEKRRSSRLLAAARRAVEIAIEQDEKSAFAYLKANT
jgi:type I restriction enzyme S subunit